MMHLTLALCVLFRLTHAVPQALGVWPNSYNVYPQTLQCPSSSNAPCFSQAQLWQLATTMLDNYMYPANVQQAQAINSSYLSPSIVGRVDVTTSLYGQELNTEYLFGLFSQIAQQRDDDNNNNNKNSSNGTGSYFSLLGVPLSYKIAHYAAYGNIVALTAIIQFNFTAVATVLPVEVDTWTLFNAQGQVQQFDYTFRWFDYLMDTLFTLLAQKWGGSSIEQDPAAALAATVAQVQQRLVHSICSAHEHYCRPDASTVQYDSYGACDAYLTQHVRLGQPWEMGRNTLVCRMLHQDMLVFRPQVHCPHIGPATDSSTMCVDRGDSYVGRVLQNDFLGSGFVAM